MADQLTSIERRLADVEQLIQQKHLPGTHDQMSHAPHKGSVNLGERASSLMEDMAHSLGGVLQDISGDIERGSIGAAFDIRHLDAVKKLVTDMGFVQSDAFGKMVNYSKGTFKGKGFEGAEVDVTVTGDKFNKGKGYLDITDNVAGDMYNSANSPSYGKGYRGRKR